MCTLMHMPEAEAALTLPIPSHLPLGRLPTCGLRREDREARSCPSLSGGCHPSRLQAGPLSPETVVLLDSMGKDDVIVKGHRGQNMAIVQCAL